MDPNNADAIKARYEGYRGWNDSAAIIADYKATGGVGKGGMVASLGSPSKPAIPDFQNIYDTAVATGTKDSQAELDKLTSQLIEGEKARNEAVAKIGDNPYLSEATMTGRIAKIENKFGADRQTIVNQQTNAQNKIAVAKADAQVKLGIAQNQYNIQNQEYQQQVNQINQYLSSGMLNDISEQEMAQIATTIGMSPDMVKSIISTSKSKNEVKPQLITIDDGKNQQIVAVDSNGTVINKQVLGPSQATTGTSGGGSSSSSKAQEKADADMQAKFEKAIDAGVKQLQGGSQWGEVWSRIKTLFPDAPPELIDSLLGTSWREPGAYQAYQANKKGL